jgi:DNA gyrase subunit B
LNTRGLGRPQYEIVAEPVAAEQGATLRIRKLHHGLSTESLVPGQFFLSADYAPIAEITKQINGLIASEGRVQRGSRQAPASDFHAVQQWLMEEAKRGRTIQRFKGLGEMNPEQLWETTVNPETRRMLQVRIEDAVAADLIFSTLMGDVVEPRREFIESNALRVANLDV